MRQKRDPQRSLLYLMARNKVAREMEAISLVLDQNPGILDPVFRDLVQSQRTDTGRGGMTAEQVLRGALLKQYRELTYEELAFHLEDSTAFRSFNRLDMGQYPCGSTLQENIKAIAAETWEAVNRVLRGEKVPAGEKVVSFFECHTDVIAEGRRDTRYGHKIFLSGGRSGMILDCVIARGNPNDAAMFPELLTRQEAIYGRLPAKTAADDGFASRDNLRLAKGRGVKDVMFAKRRGLGVLDMVKSHWVYRKLSNFRAGLEANISRLKRAFGLDRSNWRGWPGFRQYVWSAVGSYNVLVLGLLLQAP